MLDGFHPSDGRLLASAPPGISSREGRAAYRAARGGHPGRGRTRIHRPGPRVRRPARRAGAGGAPGQVLRKGDTPLEIITTRQWYLRNGGRDPDLRDALLARGREITWHPAHMRARYENWVNGLAGDWPVSRQAVLGCPSRSGTRWTRRGCRR